MDEAIISNSLAMLREAVRKNRPDGFMEALARLKQVASQDQLAKALNDLDAYGMTLLMWSESVEMTRQLLEIDACNPNVLGKMNATALYWASRRGLLPIVEDLIQAGADPKLPTIQGWTPLMAAAWKGEAKMVARLLPGSELDARDNQGRTAAWYAASYKRSEALKVLLQGGVDSEVPDEQGKRPVDVARKVQKRKKKNRGCITLLEEEEKVYLLVKARAIRDGSYFQDKEVPPYIEIKGIEEGEERGEEGDGEGGKVAAKADDETDGSSSSSPTLLICEAADAGGGGETEGKKDEGNRKKPGTPYASSSSKTTKKGGMKRKKGFSCSSSSSSSKRKRGSCSMGEDEVRKGGREHLASFVLEKILSPQSLPVELFVELIHCWSPLAAQGALGIL